MLDHVGITVSDYQRSKAFYERALAPLGLTVLDSAGSIVLRLVSDWCLQNGHRSMFVQTTETKGAPG